MVYLAVEKRSQSTVS